MDLNGSKFGDKYITRDGKTAIVIGEHQTVRRHWYDFVALEDGSDMREVTPTKFSAHDNGIAFDGFEWLDLIEKI